MTEPATGIAAFEDGSHGRARGFLVALKGILGAPSATFGSMVQQGSLLWPTVFVLLVTLIPELLTTTVELVSPGALKWAGPGLEGGDAPLLEAAQYLVLFLGLSASEVLVTPPILWVMFRLSRQRKRVPLRTMYRVCCYSHAPTLFGPGFLVSTVLSFWGLFLLCVGIKQAGGPRPIAVFGLLFVGQILAAAVAFGLVGAFNAITG